MSAFRLTSLEPLESDYCQYELQQKIKNRWTHAPCGKPATIVVRFVHDDVVESDAKLCHECLARVTHKFVTFLE